MSKSKPRASAPPRPAAAPPAKFYDGPTVLVSDKNRRKSTPNPPSTQQDAYKPAPKPAPAGKPLPPSQTQVVKVSRPKPRRSGWSLWGLITVLPLLVFASLFSTVLCPPPSAQPSSFSSYALSSLGLKTQAEESSLHKTLCYPANVYHDEVLVPYIYPAVEDVKAKVTTSPFFKETIEPTYQTARGHVLKTWNGPVKPVVDRIVRGARIVHRTYVAPHVPYVKAKFIEATAPIRMRTCALYKEHLAPHVQVAKKHTCTAYKSSKATFNQLVAHPATVQAGKQAQNAFFYGRDQGARAYQYSRPHAIWAFNEGHRHTRETVLPRTAQGIRYASKQLCHAWSVVKAQWNKFYADNLAVHCDPYVIKARATLEPLCATFNKDVYVPFIMPVLKPVLDSAYRSQDDTKPFWSYLVGSGAAEKAAKDVKQAAAETEKKAAAVKKEAEAKAAEAAAAAKAAVKEAAEAKAAAEAKEAAEAKAAAAKKAADEKTAALKKKAEEEAAKQAAIDAEIAANARAAFKKAEASRAAASNTDDLTKQAFVVPTESSASGSVTAATTSVSATEATSTETQACDSTTGGGADAEATPTEQVKEAPSKEVKDHLAEARAQTLQLKKKIDFQGKALYAKVQSETVRQAERFLELLPEMKQIGTDNMEREITRMAGGLDRLYSNSRSLTREQVEESQRMSDAKVVKILDQVTNGVKTKKNEIYQKTEPAVNQGQLDIERVLGDEYAALGKRLSIIEGVTSKDWDAYKALKKDVDAWKTKLHEAPEKAPSKQLKEVIHKVQVGAAEAITEFADFYEGWKTRQGVLRKQANDRIEAREAVSAEQRKSQATIVVPKKAPEGKATEPKRAAGKGSILDMDNKEEKKKDAAKADGTPLLAKVDEQAQVTKSAKDEL